jgi:hypothetical protein
MWAFDFHDFSQIGALENLDEGLLVTAQTGNDLSFVHSSWNEGIQPWRFQLPFESYEGPFVAHTILDRPLFRAGETVHMKHLLREQTPHGFAFAANPERPTTLSLRHLGSDKIVRFPLSGMPLAAQGAWQIPKAKQPYNIVLVRPAGKEELVGPLLIEESAGRCGVGGTSGPPAIAGSKSFVPLMKATRKVQRKRQLLVEIPIDLSVQYLAGGGAGKLPVTLRSQVRGKFVPARRSLQFTFVNGGVQEGGATW